MPRYTPEYFEGGQARKEIRKKKSCLWLFKLETGVATILYLDIIIFIVMITTSNTQLRKTKQNTSKSIDTTKSIQKQSDTSFILFNIVTDYITIFLMIIKLFYGLKYLKSYLFHGTKDEKYIMDKEGD